jgi:phosphohistidine phosphatase
VEQEPRLYEASVEDVLAVVRQRDDAIDTLMLVGHEPTSSSLARALLGGGMIRFPTAAALRIDLAITSWTALRPGMGVLRWLVIPRQLEKLREG